MDFKDYYEILGVSPQADNKTIKKAYQTLTKKYHPDLNPGNQEAENKFKEINEAYHAIADPAKRQKYDDLRANYQQWKERGGRGSFDWSTWQGSPGQGSYTRTMTPEEFAEMFGDLGFGQRKSSGAGFTGGGFSDFFSTIFGMGGSGRGFDEEDYYTDLRRQSVSGQNLEGEITITLEEAYHGAKKLIDIGDRRIEAAIPKGIRHENKIRLAGQGGKGVNGGPSGDLLLTIKIQPHAVFTRDGDNLSVNVEVDFYTAVLGGEAKVKTLSGDVMIKIPVRTQTGKILRLQRKGMPVLNKADQYGDLYAKILIVLPENLSDKEVETLQELNNNRSSS